MSFFSNSDTLRPRSNRPPSPSNAPPVQSSADPRQRSSSFSDNPTFKSAQRALGLAPGDASSGGGGGLSANSSFRRRSSGGANPGGATRSQSVLSTASSFTGLGGTTRRDSQSNPFTSPSFLKSPNPLPPSSSLNGNVPTLKTLDSYNAKNVAAVLDQGIDQGRMIDDVWQSVCVRVLPLFNGEGIRGFVEDLNNLVLTHVQRTFARVSTTNRNRYHSTHNPSLDLSSLVTGLLIADLTDLVRIGCSTLSTKLSPRISSTSSPFSSSSPTNSPNENHTSSSSSSADQKLIERLNEIWLFFYTGILPQLEAIFWVLRCDDRLRAAIGGTGFERNQERGKGRGEGRIEVRRIALIEFRDGILHPEFRRIQGTFERIYKEVGKGEESREQEELTENDGMTSNRSTGFGGLDIRRSRSQPQSTRPSTASSSVQRSTTSTTASTFLSPPIPPSHPVPTTNPTNHLPTTPIRQFSSPARLPSPDPSPSNSPTTSRRNTLLSQPRTKPPLGEREKQQSKQSLQRRLQMILVLKSLRTFDDRQEEIERLAEFVVVSDRKRRTRKNGGVERNPSGGGGGRKKKNRGGSQGGQSGRVGREDGSEAESYERGGGEGNDEDEDGEETEEEEEKREGFENNDSPRIVFDEPMDGPGGGGSRDHGYELPYSTPSSAAVSRSNSRTSRTGGIVSRRSSTVGGVASGYASPILSTSPTEAALDLSGLGYALGRVREGEEDGYLSQGGGSRGGEGSESSEGVTPTASAMGSTVGVGTASGYGFGQQTGGGGQYEVQQQVQQQKQKNKRRSLFSLHRGNSTTTATAEPPVQDSLNRDYRGLGLSGELVDGDEVVPGGGGEKLRRNLLRRNSSRNSTILQLQQQQYEREMSTVLGGKGLSSEDE